VERCLACEADAIGTPGGELLERLRCHHVIFFRVANRNGKRESRRLPRLPTVWLLYKLVKSIHFANRIAVQRPAPVIPGSRLLPHVSATQMIEIKTWVIAHGPKRLPSRVPTASASQARQRSTGDDPTNGDLSRFDPLDHFYLTVRDGHDHARLARVALFVQ